MKIALVGPGIMPIPPPGWGAVEILLFDYYTILKKTHEVDLINIIRSNSSDSEPNTEYTWTLIHTINNKRYDFVHIHYDVLYHIIPHLLCKNVAITSHFPYIDQPQLHGEYSQIFNGICNSNAYVFALSKKDKTAFLQAGISVNRLHLMLNGANHTEIIPNNNKINQDRSIYLAKIEPRKRQILVTSLDQMDFYGKAPNEFIHPNYKGEPSRDVLMNIFPTYGNLVLLSNGENGTPLVIKEAFMAGLPVVISEYCVDDIDTTLPFIDVIPESRINDLEYIHQIISENRKKKVQYSQQIREYAIEHFSWEKLISEYVSTIESIVRLTIVLVGPGLMPIPPVGWGACEILVWNYACELRKLGYHVEIINKPHMHEIIETIRCIQPDFVHIQYDNHANIIPHIIPFCRAIAITSHFAYLEQSEKWNTYYNVWNEIIKHKQPNVYHFVLSKGISNVYERYGIDSGKIFITPNGADPSLFRYTDKPMYPERSIVVAKVERRKGQHLVQHNSSVWFAGNRGDDTFDYSNPRWLGEWNKEQLYNSLTEYGNLVLLSEGEADPLVIKEAFVAGLGVVISRWATANLDLSLPFITVIPNDKMNDKLYIDDAIEKNRIISVEMRSEIKEYGKQFHWDQVIKQYVKYVKAIMDMICLLNFHI